MARLRRSQQQRGQPSGVGGESPEGATCWRWGGGATRPAGSGCWGYLSYTGALVHWCTGTPVHWYTGPLAHWHTRTLVQTHALRNTWHPFLVLPPVIVPKRVDALTRSEVGRASCSAVMSSASIDVWGRGLTVIVGEAVWVTCVLSCFKGLERGGGG